MRGSLLLYFIGLALVSSVPAEETRPNFIVIMADDIGAGELSCYGHPTHETPVLDRLAAEGIKFETCFAPPVCHPTRFLLMTGQYGFRTGVVNFENKRGGLDRKDPRRHLSHHLTFGEIFKKAGYATAIAGKWQLAGAQPNLITECGFDDYCMWGYQGYYTKEDQTRVTAAGIDFVNRYWHPSIVQNGEWVPTVEDDYGPDKFTDFLCHFMERKTEEPFFLYYPMVLTHTPWKTTPGTTKGPEDRAIRHSKSNLEANVAYMDKLVGRLVSKLDELGLRDNTVLIFTGDNGTGGNGKSQPTELGARVPMIINGPSLIKQRGGTLELTDLSDVLPTMADFAGVTLPEDREFDGISLVPFLTGIKEETRDWIFAYQADRRILRTKRWLLEDNSPLHWGHLFDCGESRDGKGYLEKTDSQDPEAIAARRFFDALIEDIPAPVIEKEGAPNDPKEE